MKKAVDANGYELKDFDVLKLNKDLPQHGDFAVKDSHVVLVGTDGKGTLSVHLYKGISNGRSTYSEKKTIGINENDVEFVQELTVKKD